jgi:hypothetical protein
MIDRYCVFSDKRECTLFPDICKNGATCVELEGAYRCDCTIGWTDWFLKHENVVNFVIIHGIPIFMNFLGSIEPRN